MAASQNRSQESLSQALGAIIQVQIVAFLVIWLAIGFPVTCQMHGTMSMYELEPHVHSSDSGTNTEFPCELHNHTPAPSMTMLLSLITSLTPDQITCHYPVYEKPLSFSSIQWPLQLNVLPPEQPP